MADFNHIELSHTDDKQVRMTVCINGKPVAWINYTATQLDELLQHLERFRKELRG